MYTCPACGRLTAEEELEDYNGICCDCDTLAHDIGELAELLWTRASYFHATDEVKYLYKVKRQLKSHLALLDESLDK